MSRQHTGRWLLAGGGGALAAGAVALGMVAAAAAVIPGSDGPGEDDVPPRAALAYQRAAPRCGGLRWQLLAGIGHVESDHGRAGGARLDEVSGETSPPIFGPPLDGRDGTERHPIGPWLGWWGLPGPFEQGVGPFQFRAPTFSAHATGGDSDGVANPHDLDDAAAAAAVYLCAVVGGRITDERRALAAYNRGDRYATAVLAYADRLAAGERPREAGPCPVAGESAFTDTWGAPRSGGRRHRGVDLFARSGTPVVAPVDGVVSFGHSALGGASFRLWGRDGTYYYGAHLAAYGDTEGPVTAGTVVGYVGQSGNAAGTPPHLHFEIHPGRRPGDPPAPVNPTPAVAAWCAHHRTGTVIGGGD